MKVKVTMLGCGSSFGVPQIGCDCAVCRSGHPRNKRTRVSVLVEAQGKHLLVDTSPDLRMQVLANHINRIDAVLYTHDHADHLHGIDDLRLFNIMTNATIPVYGEEKALSRMKSRFPYVFQPKPEPIWYRPSLEPIVIPTDPPQPFDVLGVTVEPIWQEHVDIGSLCFRIGNFAYSTDVSGFTEESLARLEKLDVWIVDCQRYKPSYAHANLETTLAWIDRLKPKRAIFTHMSHDFDYEQLCRELPAGVEPGYDGLVAETA